MKHLGLFEGIGGFSLAARWMGWETVAWCEWNEFGQRVLHHHFPEAIGHGDITQTDFTPYANKIDILTGGFPCQPYSQAGKRLGKDDERHLFPEMLRAIREIKPTYIVGENVYGLTNWNGGMVFEEVCADLESEGYEVQPVLLPASGIGAPHHRMRVWFVARLTPDTESARTRQDITRIRCLLNGLGKWKEGLTPDTDSLRHRRRCEQSITNQSEEWSMDNDKERYWDGIWSETSGRCRLTPDTECFCTQRFINGHRERQFGRGDWSSFPTQSPICGGDDGLPTQLDGITFPKWRAESIKAYGNAIVPQVALQIFKAIEAMSFQQD